MDSSKLPTASPLTINTTKPVNVEPQIPSPKPDVNQPETKNPNLSALGFTIEEAQKAKVYLKLMVYGKPGVGKTTFAATAADVPEMGDVLFISAESGHLSISDRKDIHLIRLSQYNQLARVIKWFETHVRICRLGDKKALVEHQKLVMPSTKFTEQTVPQYRTLIVDSLSEVFKYAMYKVLKTEVGNMDLAADIPQAQFQHWGEAGEMVRMLIRTLRDIPVHTIFVAAENEKEDELKRKSFVPLIPGKLGNEIAGFLDTVAYMAARPGTPDGNSNEGGAKSAASIQRRLFLQPDNRFIAKNRIPTMKEVAYIENPTMKALFEYISGK
ncbi:MAG: AAA family ATPase [Waterburya sp.]